MLQAIFSAGCLCQWTSDLPYWAIGLEAAVLVASLLKQEQGESLPSCSGGSEDLPLAHLLARQSIDLQPR